MRVGDHVAEFGKVAADAGRLARRGNALVEEQLAPEHGRSRVLDRTWGGTAVVSFDGAEILCGRRLWLCQSKHHRGCKQYYGGNDECDACLMVWSDHWPPSSARRASSSLG